MVDMKCDKCGNKTKRIIHTTVELEDGTAKFELICTPCLILLQK